MSWIFSVNTWSLSNFNRMGWGCCLLVLLPAWGSAQEVDCPSDPAYGAEQAIAIAQAKVPGMLNPYAGPHAVLIPFKGDCYWQVKVSTSRHTNRGNCKRTNGCTLVKMTNLYIDPDSGKIAHRKTRKKLYPNYE